MERRPRSRADDRDHQPAGFGNFFHELAEMIESDGQDLVEISALAGRYGLEFGQPEWLPGIVSRYGLTPPAG